MRLCNPAWMHVCLYATTPTLLECGDLSVALCGKCSGRVATTCALHCTLKRAPVHLLLWQVWEIPAGWSWTPPRPLGLVQPVVMRNSEACTIANMSKEKKERSQKSLRGHSSPSSWQQKPTITDVKKIRECFSFQSLFSGWDEEVRGRQWHHRGHRVGERMEGGRIHWQLQYVYGRLCFKDVCRSHTHTLALQRRHVKHTLPLSCLSVHITLTRCISLITALAVHGLVSSRTSTSSPHRSVRFLY